MCSVYFDSYIYCSFFRFRNFLCRDRIDRLYCCALFQTTYIVAYTHVYVRVAEQLIGILSASESAYLPPMGKVRPIDTRDKACWSADLLLQCSSSVSALCTATHI